MKLGFSQPEIIQTAKSLGLPTDGFIQRRVARAFNLLENNKVTEVDDGIFRVRSQYEPSKSYIVNVNHGFPSCDCPDGERTIHCKHRIASLLYLHRQSQATVKVTWDDTENSYMKRGRWWVTDYKARVKYIIYRDGKGNLICPCGRKPECEHRKAIREYLSGRRRVNASHANNGGNGKKVVNDCGSVEAKQLQDKLNGSNGNGDKKSPSQPMQLDLSDPFQECESYDIDQIEGRKNGELAWKLSNGEYVISYRGIMKLAEKHGIEYSVSLNDDTNTVIAKAMNGNERVSGKPVNGSVDTAMELAKRNAARQLLPLPEIKAIEYKAKLESEFDWQRAYAKCVEIVGGKAQVDIIINDLVNWGKLRKDNPSHYNRIEWLLIHEYCQKEASIERDPGSTNNWSYNSAVFIDRCKEAIEQVKEEKKSIEANEQPLEGDNGIRKLQMDKKLRTWLVEPDGTKKPISCREIAEQLDSYEKSIIKRLRMGIDSGADISTVELDD